MSATLKTHGDSLKRNRTLQSAALPRRVQRALEHLHALASSELERKLERMLSSFEQELFREAEQAQNPGLQSGYFETLRQVRQHRDKLIPQFLAGLESALTGIREPAAVRPARQMPVVDFDTLRLVDDAEVNEDGEVRSIAARHEARAGLPLLLLGQRFGVLAGAPAFDAERLPVGPYSLARLLVESSRVFQVDQAARLLLLRNFDQHAMGGYAQFVETLNTLLARENILPGLAYVPLRTRPTAQPAPAKGAAADAAPAHARHHAPTSSTPGAAERPHTAWFGEADTDRDSRDENLAFSLLQQLLSGRRDLLGKLRAESGARGARTSLATPDVVAALQAQQSPREPGTAGRRSVADVKRGVLAQSRQQHGRAMSLGSEDNDTFELLGMLYSQMQRELREDAPSNALVERLQVPMLRVALQDRGFFVSSQHPARQLLNAVAEAGANWLSDDEVDPQLEAQLHRAVDQVVENYEGDASVFKAANQSLQEHLQTLARKAEVSERRHIDAARGKEKLELAKRHAASVIEHAIHDQPLPKFVRSLLQQAWCDALTLTLLRHGDDSEEWRQQVKATAQIAGASVGSAAAPAGLDRRIEHALALVGYAADEASAIARRLTIGRDAAEDDPASRTELAMKLKTRARLGDDAERTAPDLPPRNPDEQRCYNQLRNLPFGTWIEFVKNQQGEVIRRRLAWFSTVTDHALFVNQRGQRVDEQSLDKLARMMAHGQARVVSAGRGRLVDRAWHGTLNALRSFADPDDSDATEAP